MIILSTKFNTCRICNEKGYFPEYEVREMMFGTRNLFRYFQCEKCGCLQINKIPQNLSQYYPKNYYSFQFVPEKRSDTKFYRWLQKQRCRTAIFGRGFKLNAALKRLVPLPDKLFEKNGGLATGDVIKRSRIKNFSARFLDVGCGAFSHWLEDLSCLGFHHLTGVDPFINSDSHYENIHILKDDLDNIQGTYDLITFHHSLEHMPKQFEILQAASARLSKDGTCLIRIPLVSSFVWEKYGVNWVELDAPRHLYLHSINSIIKIARVAGLELFDIVYDSLPLEFFGSEQYVRDIPLTDPCSLWVDFNSSLFTAKEKTEFAEMATKVNAEQCGGRAGFYFRKLSSSLK